MSKQIIAELKKTISEMKKSHKSEISSLKSDHKNELDSLKADLKLSESEVSDLKKTNEGLQSDIDDTKKKLADAIDEGAKLASDSEKDFLTPSEIKKLPDFPFSGATLRVSLYEEEVPEEGVSLRSETAKSRVLDIQGGGHYYTNKVSKKTYLINFKVV